MRNQVHNSGGEKGVVKTGQTTSYVDYDDGYYQKGLPSSDVRFVDNGDGTINDNVTGLQWVKEPQKIIPGATGINATNQIQTAGGNWATNTTYTGATVVFAMKADYTGTITAARSAYTVTASSAIFTADDVGRTVYIGSSSAGIIKAYTSSTVVTVDTTGTISSDALKIYSYYVSAIAHTSGSVNFATDLAANPTYWRETIWTSSASSLTSTPATFRWTSSITVCEALDYAGHTDWRLPNVTELQSIANYGAVSPASWSTYFPNTVSSYYWSGTTSASSTSSAWTVYFSYGSVSSYGKTTAYYVRPVRSSQ